MVKVAIVILNWNGRNFLEKFLPSVLQHSSGYPVIVADNNSTDDSLLFLEQHYSDVRIIRLPRNEGFSKGYNDALSQVEAEYYVLLNSDVEVTPGWIDPVLELMDEDPLVAACQPKIKSFHYRNYFEYAGAAGGFIDKWGYPFCRGRLFNTLEEDLGQYDDTREVFWATGACLFVRADIYKKLGGLDNDFFAHMEEIDLCWRMKNQGYKVAYCGLSEVFHVGGGTLPKTSPHKTYLNFRNGLTLLYKNLPQNKIFPIILVRLLLDGVAAVKFTFSDGPAYLLAIVKAHWHFFFSLRKVSYKRKLNRKHIISDIHPEIYSKSIVWKYYVEKVKIFRNLNF